MLTAQEDSAPPPQHWSWKKITLAVFAGLAVLIFALICHDQELEPCDDLSPAASFKGDAGSNGYLYLEQRWGKISALPKDLKEASLSILWGEGPMDESVIQQLRHIHGPARKDLTSALELPEYSSPATQSPTDTGGDQIWLMGTFRYLILEAIAACHQGDFPTSISILSDLRNLSRRHLDGGGGLVTFLVGIHLYNLTDNCACRILADERVTKAEIVNLAEIWNREPAINAAWVQAMKHETIFFRECIKLIDAGNEWTTTAAGLRKSQLLLFKKNRTLNKYNRRMRFFITNALELSTTSSGAELLRVSMSPPSNPRWIKYLNSNFAGEKLIDSTDSYRAILPAAITKCLFHPMAMKVKMALLRWRLDHEATLPGSLDELVPTYLPAVPLDPWSGKAILWDQSTKVIYSIGSDWKPDPPIFKLNSQKWFSDAHEAPGLRMELPPFSPTIPPLSETVKPKPRKVKPAPAPNISVAPSSANAN